jgi:hypothetical protein
VWRRHADLAVTHSVERMRVHELRKTLAWYSRGLRGGADLRQRCGTEKNPAALLDMGESFFDRVAEDARTHGVEAVSTAPADPVAKSIARQERLRGANVEADECAA